jgi:hypothetical protein
MEFVERLVISNRPILYLLVIHFLMSIFARELLDAFMQPIRGFISKIPFVGSLFDVRENFICKSGERLVDGVCRAK